MIGFIDAFFVQSLLITINAALLLIYTLSSSHLHEPYDSQFPLIVSWQRISTQKLSLQITTNSIILVLDSVLLCTNYAVWVWVWVILRPTASRPVCLGIKPPTGAYDQMFFTVRTLRVFDMGRLLWREDGSVFYNVQYKIHFTVSDLRLPQPGGPGPCIYIPRNSVTNYARLYSRYINETRIT
jgi:hypothetical protein